MGSTNKQDGHIRNVDRFYNGQTIGYRIGPDIATSPAATLFFDDGGAIPLLNSNLSITDIRLLLCLFSYCDSETNVICFKPKTREDILFEMGKYGLFYKEDTLLQSKKKLVREGVLGTVARNYVMINPAIMYYGGKKNVFSYKSASKKGRRKLPSEEMRLERMREFRQLVDKENPVGQKLVAKVLLDIYLENQDSEYLDTSRKKR